MDFVNFFRVLNFYVRVFAETLVVLKIITVFIATVLYVILANWGSIGVFLLMVQRLFV